jgi:hypothetical protein
MSKISGAMVAEKRHTCRAGQISQNFNNKKEKVVVNWSLSVLSSLPQSASQLITFMSLLFYCNQAIHVNCYKLQGCFFLANLHVRRQALEDVVDLVLARIPNTGGSKPLVFCSLCFLL